MHAVGEYVGAQRSNDGDMCLLFAVDPEDMEALNDLEGQRVVIDVKKYNQKRSLNANAYFWLLCDRIAKRLGSDKDTVYLMMLRDHGCFDYYELPLVASEQIKELYRYAEEDHRYVEYRWNEKTNEGKEVDIVALKCYRGSHEYDTKEMSELINGTVNDAHDLGIETWTQAEIDNLLEGWNGK